MAVLFCGKIFIRQLNVVEVKGFVLRYHAPLFPAQGRQVAVHIKIVLLVGVGKVFIPGMLDKERAEAFFDRLFSNIEHIDIAEMNGKHILLSLGACFYDGMDGITFDQLYRRADIAMYDSKKKQGYSATIFDAKQ